MDALKRDFDILNVAHPILLPHDRVEELRGDDKDDPIADNNTSTVVVCNTHALNSVITSKFASTHPDVLLKIVKYTIDNTPTVMSEKRKDRKLWIAVGSQGVSMAISTAVSVYFNITLVDMFETIASRTETVTESTVGTVEQGTRTIVNLLYRFVMRTIGHTVDNTTYAVTTSPVFTQIVNEFAIQTPRDAMVVVTLMASISLWIVLMIIITRINNHICFMGAPPLTSR